MIVIVTYHDGLAVCSGGDSPEERYPECDPVAGDLEEHVHRFHPDHVDDVNVVHPDDADPYPDGLPDD